MRVYPAACIVTSQLCYAKLLSLCIEPKERFLCPFLFSVFPAFCWTAAAAVGGVAVVVGGGGGGVSVAVIVGVVVAVLLLLSP